VIQEPPVQLVRDYWTNCDAHPSNSYEDCGDCVRELVEIVEDAIRGRRSLGRIRRLSHRQRLDLDTMLLMAGVSRK
jgi:hypothetical protein